MRRPVGRELIGNANTTSVTASPGKSSSMQSACAGATPLYASSDRGIDD
jgi:hypothetical protein